MTTLLLLAAAALASTTSPGLLWPGASPIEANHGSAGGYVAPVVVPDTIAGAVGARVVYAPTDRFALQFDGALLGSGSGAAPGMGVGARYLVANGEYFRFALTAEVAGLTSGDTTLGGGMAGIAMEAGSRTVWFDASSPILGLAASPDDAKAYALYPMLLSEMGVNVRIAEHHVLRAGNASLLPTLSYSYEAERWFLRGDVTALLAFAEIPAVKLTAGARF